MPNDHGGSGIPSIGSNTGQKAPHRSYSGSQSSSEKVRKSHPGPSVLILACRGIPVKMTLYLNVVKSEYILRDSIYNTLKNDSIVLLSCHCDHPKRKEHEAYLNDLTHRYPFQRPTNALYASLTNSSSVGETTEVAIPSPLVVV